MPEINGQRLTNVGDPIHDKDAVNLRSLKSSNIIVYSGNTRLTKYTGNVYDSSGNTLFSFVDGVTVFAIGTLSVSGGTSDSIGYFLPLSGGTVTGQTNFTAGLSAVTLTANTSLFGIPSALSLYTTTGVTANSGVTDVYTIPINSYRGAFFDYMALDSSNARAGNIISIWSGISITYAENLTTDIGNTSALTFSVVVSGNNAIFKASANTNNWTIKTIIRSI